MSGGAMVSLFAGEITGKELESQPCGISPARRMGAIAAGALATMKQIPSFQRRGVRPLRKLRSHLNGRRRVVRQFSAIFS
jgi:hypothetical protein